VGPTDPFQAKLISVYTCIFVHTLTYVCIHIQIGPNDPYADTVILLHIEVYLYVDIYMYTYTGESQQPLSGYGDLYLYVYVYLYIDEDVVLLIYVFKYVYILTYIYMHSQVGANDLYQATAISICTSICIFIY